MPDLEFLVWRARARRLLYTKYPDLVFRKFKQPVSPKQPDVAVTTLSRSIEVKPA
ncbi:MAG: hypothetical protein LM580_03160 [Thermofilum sp.]|nr:hypothetical protein [Thermofilum sp.]